MPRILITLLTVLFSLACVTACGDSWATNESSSSSSEDEDVIDSDDDDDFTPSIWRELTEIERQLIEADNRFGIDLFKRIVVSEPDTNIFISPLSVSMALGMAYNGADGQTATQMQNTLGLQELTVDEINQAYKDLIALFVGLDEQVAFKIANSVWYSDAYSPAGMFLQNLTTFFAAQVEAIDVLNPASVDVINDWVKENTEQKIDQIIDALDPTTVLLLINAIYFKGGWTEHFEPYNTTDAQFNIPDGSQVPCRIMSLTTYFDYYENDDYQAIDLKYGAGDYSMTLFLPAVEADIDEIIAGIDQDSYAAMTTDFYVREVRLQMPSFELEYEKSLGDVLQLMGMIDAFDSGVADFSNLIEDEDIFISEVLHKTYVKVDEVGTEAAAATVDDGDMAAPYVNMMRLDRPFIFVIRENNSGTIIFIGKIVNPS
jgi:serine protease inhibitor